MAIVTVLITDVSAASRVSWHKVPLAERQKIKESLAIHKLHNFRRFSFRYHGENEVQEGYAHKTALAKRLNLVVTIKTRGNTFARCTMQRMSHTQPFIRLI